VSGEPDRDVPYGVRGRSGAQVAVAAHHAGDSHRHRGRHRHRRPRAGRPGPGEPGDRQAGEQPAHRLARLDHELLRHPRGPWEYVDPDIRRVAATSTSNQPLIAGNTNWTTTVAGTTPSWQQVRARTLSAGRFLTQDDIDQARPVVVLGPDTAAQLFSGRAAVGQTVSVNGSTFTVIGVLDAIGSSSTTSTSSDDDIAVVPQTTFADRVSSSTNRASVSTIYLEAMSGTALSAAYQEADALLLTRHGVTATAADFSIASQQSLLKTATSTDRTLTILLGGVAAISLLVGGIGVMNIMLVSVTERVREIGLRKALGATPAAVRRQFLVEASALGTTGGLLGLVVGVIAAGVLPHFLNQPVTISPLAAVAAVVVALGIGITAGVYPAGRAARLAPIDALRTD
jgi:putative ABC transport system permease protein